MASYSNTNDDIIQEFNCILIGKAEVGKTTFLERANGAEPGVVVEKTFSYKEKRFEITTNVGKFGLTVFDTAGDMTIEAHNARTGCCTDWDCAILMYDMSSGTTFNRLGLFWDELPGSHLKRPAAVVGNKKDLIQKEVTRCRFAEKRDMSFHTVCSLHGPEHELRVPFMELVRKLMKAPWITIPADAKEALAQLKKKGIPVKATGCRPFLASVSLLARQLTSKPLKEGWKEERKQFFIDHPELTPPPPPPKTRLEKAKDYLCSKAAKMSENAAISKTSSDLKDTAKSPVNKPATATRTSGEETATKKAPSSVPSKRRRELVPLKPGESEDGIRVYSCNAEESNREVKPEESVTSSTKGRLSRIVKMLPLQGNSKLPSKCSSRPSSPSKLAPKKQKPAKSAKVEPPPSGPPRKSARVCQPTTNDVAISDMPMPSCLRSSRPKPVKRGATPKKGDKKKK